jgi:hypothetical protein
MSLYRWEFRSSGTYRCRDREEAWELAQGLIQEDLENTYSHTQFLRELTPEDPEWQEWVEECEEFDLPGDSCNPDEEG